MLHKNSFIDDHVRERRMKTLDVFTLTLQVFPFLGSKFIGVFQNRL